MSTFIALLLVLPVVYGTLYLDRDAGLVDIPAGIPADTSNLDLDTNNITTIPADLCTNLPNLVTLTLARNPITSIDVNLFEDCLKLRTLKFAQCDLMSLDFAYKYIQRFVEIDVQDNNVGDILIDPSGITGLDDDVTSNFEVLYMPGSSMTHFPDIWLTSVRATMTELNVGYADLTCVDNAHLSLYSQLNSLSLYGTDLDTFVDPASPCRHLSSVPAAFDVWPRLTALAKLQLSHTRLTLIPPSIIGIAPNLEELHLSNIQITVVNAGDLAGIQSLRKLMVQNTPIVTLEIPNNLPQLLEINLRNIPMTEMPDLSTLVVSSQLTIDVDNNNFACGDAFCWIKICANLDIEVTPHSCKWLANETEVSWDVLSEVDLGCGQVDLACRQG